MIKLINGRGQMGTKLEEKLSQMDKLPQINKDVLIYHTWNIDDKSEETQRKCYDDFTEFVSNNKDKKVIFTSTLSENESPYLKYKIMAESYIMEHHSDYKIIKFPTIIGKGPCQKFKERIIKPYGVMELITLDEAADKIITELIKPGKIIFHHGHKIDAYIVNELIKFGAK